MENFVIVFEPQDVALIESMQLGLETVVGAIFDGSAEFLNSAAESKFQLCTIFEGCFFTLVVLWACIF